MKSGGPSDGRYREFSSAQGEPHPSAIVFCICDLEYFGGRNPNQHLVIDRYHPALPGRLASTIQHVGCNMAFVPMFFFADLAWRLECSNCSEVN